MPSPAVFDIAKLLAPIPGDKPVGSDLRADASPASSFYAIKDARTKARANERALLAKLGDPTAADPEPPDWRPVLTNAVKALSEKSKDLEVTAYLIEALIRLHGFAGLRDGFRLARELVEKYWDGLFPLPDEDGLETRVAALTGLNGDDAEGTLIAPIAKAPITEPGSIGRLSSSDYQESLSLSKMTDAKAKEKKIAQGVVTLEAFQSAVGESSPKFFANLVEDLMQCSEEFAKLTAALDQRCQGRSPPSSNIKSALVSCLDTIKDVAKAKLAVALSRDDGDGKAAPAAGAAGAAQPSGVQTDVIRTRDDAFKTLLKVAEYFRRTEPHSPLSYALEQAVRWGKMSLPELLAELVPEEASRKNIFKQVGIKGSEAAAKPGADPAKK